MDAGRGEAAEPEPVTVAVFSASVDISRSTRIVSTRRTVIAASLAAARYSASACTILSMAASALDRPSSADR